MWGRCWRRRGGCRTDAHGGDRAGGLGHGLQKRSTRETHLHVVIERACEHAAVHASVTAAVNLDHLRDSLSREDKDLGIL